MGKDVPPLSLGDFKLVPLLLLVNIAGFSIIFWSAFAFENTEGPNNFTIYFSLGFLLLWGVLSFVFRKGTSFFLFFFLFLFSAVIGITWLCTGADLFYIKKDSFINLPVSFTGTCCVVFGLNILFRKFKTVSSTPSFLFAISTWPWLLVIAFFVFGLMNIESS